MERIPYTTKTGLKIGSRYEPPRPYYYSRDMELLQGALLGKRQKIAAKPVAILCMIFLAGLWLITI